MNSREISQKSSKNKFSAFVEQSKAQAKVKNSREKKILSPEKLEEKAAGLQAFLEKKAQRKVLRAKGRA
jgi:hypothetical protein